MKRTALNKVGKLGKANKQARDKIAQIAEEHGLNYCEIGLEGCTGTWPLAPAHLHKRSWYKGDVDLLSDCSQWVSSCVVCHNLIEHDSELTEEVFDRLRP